ncbi:hypothetical protein CL659_02515 [bacterium]|nr:hypothetical protein [bacterium]|tara:strand:- start:27072 stop:29822 length:2751 start_codon:yes stop_codon:yes gene_type:complete
MSNKSLSNGLFSNNASKDLFLNKDEKGWYSSFQDFRLSVFSKILSRKFDKKVLISPVSSRTSAFPHQISTCETVINRMSGRAILADEVGLGKTIEAGMILTEYILRKEASNVLIVVPSGLTEQWKEELLDKFNITIPVVDGRVGYSLNEFLKNNSMVVTSLAYAKREGYRDSFFEKQWDIVIVDEAHHLKNVNTMNYKFVKSLKAKKILLLTATPLQNSLTELFNLVNLVSPHAINIAEMGKRFAKNFNKKTINSLKSILKSLMVRSRRSDIRGVDELPPRKAETLGVSLSEDYLKLYDRVSRYAINGYKKSVTNNNSSYIFYLMTLQRMLTSSKGSFVSSLRKRKTRLLEIKSNLNTFNPKEVLDFLPISKKKNNKKTLEKELNLEIDSISEILKECQSVSDVNKMDVLLRFLRKLYKKDKTSKILIFTEFLKTQDTICEILKKSGFDVQIYRGGMSVHEKNEIIENFQKGQILVSTEAGSEGRNLQFANVVVNYDLPWNPMKIEQRIGRVHRLGQKKEVLIVNLIAKKTIEDHLVKILEKKLDLFKNTIGELETILGYMASENDPESVVMEAFVDSYGSKRKLKKLDSSLDSSIKKVDKSLESSFAKSGIDLRPENLNNLENIKFFNDGEIVELAFSEFLDKYNCLKDSDDFELKFSIPHFLKEGSLRFFPELIRGTFSKDIALSRTWIDYLTINHPFLTSSIKDVTESPLSFSVFKRSDLKEIGFDTLSNCCVAFFSKIRWSYKKENFEDVFVILTDSNDFLILDKIPDSLLWPAEIPCRISDDFSLEPFFNKIDSIEDTFLSKKKNAFKHLVELEDFRFNNLKSRISDAIDDYKMEFNKIHIKVMSLSKNHDLNEDQKNELIKLKKERTSILTKSSKLKKDLAKLENVRSSRRDFSVSVDLDVFAVLKMHII